MIAKNEEKNIERALGWAKGLAYEQIVVDTGSSDRTVELAEKMGAKVYHFEWISDFAAAKNYAIEQATGNWIAFLDADEYFSSSDAKKLMIILKRIQNDPIDRNKYTSVVCPMLQLDDGGNTFAVQQQYRIFRNRPDIRYKGRIHENLTFVGDIVSIPEIRIVHTGYAQTVFKDTKKVLQYEKILREELASSPDDPHYIIYLADSLRISGEKEKLDEASMLYRRALCGKQAMDPRMKQSAYNSLLQDFINRHDMRSGAEGYCVRALEDFPGDPDFLFYYGVILNRKQNHEAAFSVLQECERALLNTTAVRHTSNTVLARPVELYKEMVNTAHALNDKESMVGYLTIVLGLDKYGEGFLPKYLSVLKSSGVSDEELSGLIGKMYDYDSVKDKAFLLRAAGAAGNEGLFNMIKAMITDEERSGLTGDE